MRLLLDTCVFIWLTQAPAQLTAAARRAIDNAENELWLSHASIWEVHLKHLAGKLTLPDKPRVWLEEQMSVWGVQDFPLDLPSVHLTSELPRVHKDPFDRMLVAQAMVERMPLVSADSAFDAYGITRLW